MKGHILESGKESEDQADVQVEGDSSPGGGTGLLPQAISSATRKLVVRSRMFANPLPKILVVEDQPSVRAFVVESLEPLASRVAQTADAVGALETIESGDFDIVVSDLYLPGATGLDLLAMAHQSQWDVTFILMTGRAEVEQVITALRLQAADFLLKPFTLQDLTEAVTRSHRRLILQREARAYRGSLEASIQRRTRDLEAALRFVEANFQATLEALVAALDAREHETYAHSSRVRAYTTHLARLLGYPPALLPQLEHAALLHDIGKIAVSDAILLKPGKLTEEEWVEMRKHPAAGEQILTRVSFLRSAAFIVRHHHELFFDGSGYPDGLAREQIPLGARIFAFADTLDAITSDRRYRKAPGFDAVQSEVRRCIGTQFDPRVVEIFCRIPKETWQELRARVEQRECPPPDPDPARRTAVPLVAEPRQAGG